VQINIHGHKSRNVRLLLKNSAAAALFRFVCLFDWNWKTASALKAMRVCLYSIPALIEDWLTPERPAPSLLQDVLVLAVGRQSDWSG